MYGARDELRARARGARQSLRRYLLHVWADNPQAATREALRIDTARDRVATTPGDDVEVTVRGWPRPVRRHYDHPFHVYYEHHPGVLDVIRLHHRARRPLPSHE